MVYGASTEFRGMICSSNISLDTSGILEVEALQIFYLKCATLAKP